MRAGMDASNWEGFEPRNCREHRTVGPHRAWCHDDGEWCYPSSPCRGCDADWEAVALNAMSSLSALGVDVSKMATSTPMVMERFGEYQRQETSGG